MRKVMKPNRTKLASLVLGMAFICSGSRASITTETFTTSYGSASAPLAIGGSAFPVVLDLPQFNTALGSLVEIDLTLKTTGVLQAEVLNTGAATNFSNASATGTITVTGPAGVQSQLVLTTTPFSGSVGLGTLSSPTLTLGPAASLSGQDDSTVAPADFGAYEDNGSGGQVGLSLNAVFSGNYGGMGPMDVSFSGEPGDYGSLEVDYMYEAAVPEPQNLFLLGLCGVCFYLGLPRMRSALSCQLQ